MADVLVTGGAGYIGAHACKALAKAGHRPVTFDSLVHGHRDAVRWGPLEEGDLLDGERVERLFSDYDFACVMHFAAFIAVGESTVDPGKYYRNNVGGTLSLLQAMARHGVDAIVFSSTAAVYGTPEIVPIPESAALAPINPYGWSKLTSEQMIADFGEAHGIRYTVLRYFNACGADPDGEIGEDHEPETHLIPLALEAVTGGKPLTLFGEDYPTPDGTCIRDYIHVADLAAAHVAALERLRGGAQSATLNLGTGRGVSIRDVFQAIERVTGQEVPHIVGPRRSGDPAALVAGPARALQQLGWTPLASDIDSIVESAWRWHRR
jgi:UDP-arabinose 4-epimerase